MRQLTINEVAIGPNWATHYYLDNGVVIYESDTKHWWKELASPIKNNRGKVKDTARAIPLRTDKCPLMSSLSFSQQSENDLVILEEYKLCAITIKSLDGDILERFTPPSTGWSVNLVRAMEVEKLINDIGYDVFIGSHWFGSSEM